MKYSLRELWAMVFIPALTLAAVMRPEPLQCTQAGIMGQSVTQSLKVNVRVGAYNAPLCGCIPTCVVTGSAFADARSGWTPGCADHPAIDRP